MNVPSTLRMKPYRNASSPLSRVNAPTITLPLFIPPTNVLTAFGTAKVAMLPSGWRMKPTVLSSPWTCPTTTPASLLLKPDVLMASGIP